MKLLDLTDDLYIIQDEWSLNNPFFGEDNHLKVIGCIQKAGEKSRYAVECSVCILDPELFRGGYFSIVKADLKKGNIPCGCSKIPKWSQEQYEILCSRSAKGIGYTFLGFEGPWKGGITKIKMFCEKHGEWRTGNVAMLIHQGVGCIKCHYELVGKLKTKPDSVMVEDFMKLGAFHPETKFWRSERKDSEGRFPYWHVSCPECKEGGESTAGNLRKGKRACACSKSRQKEAYINLVSDNYDVVALKFGVANNSRRRVKEQNVSSIYNIKTLAVYLFPSTDVCKRAERECKMELECGILSREEMPDGWTETTWVYNLDKIIEIYENNGGILEHEA